MLKKISVRDVRLGMHVHSLCGAWLDHPFWKTKFLLEDTADLDKLQASGVTDCWIDIGKGLDVVAVTAAPLAAATGDAPEPAAAAPTPGPVPVPPAPQSTDFAEEVRRASVLIGKSRQAMTELFGQVRLGRAIDAEECLPLVDEIASSVWRNPGAMVSLARLKTHDDYTYMHSVAVCALMVALARQLGADEQETRLAGLGGLLHDMGKAAMPLDVLNKPGRLTDDEFRVIKTHPERGFELLREGGSAPVAVLDVCLHHHEKMDGSGYPRGLAGDEISKMARMGAVCDVYDAITSNRPYKAGWDPAEAIRKMAEWRGGHFDDAVFQAFVKSLGIYPTGSLVRLQSGRLAVVVSQNERSLVTPVVKVFFSTRSQMHLPPELLDLGSAGCSDRIAARESNAQWKFTHLESLWVGADTLKRMGK